MRDFSRYEHPNAYLDCVGVPPRKYARLAGSPSFSTYSGTRRDHSDIYHAQLPSEVPASFSLDAAQSHHSASREECNASQECSSARSTSDVNTVNQCVGMSRATSGDRFSTSRSATTSLHTQQHFNRRRTVHSTPLSHSIALGLGQHSFHLGSPNSTESARQCSQNAPDFSERLLDHATDPSSSENSYVIGEASNRHYPDPFGFSRMPRSVATVVLAAIYSFGKQSEKSFSMIREAFNLFSPYRFSTEIIQQYIHSLQQQLVPVKINYCPECDVEMGQSEESRCRNRACSLMGVALTHGKRKVTVLSYSLQKQLEVLLTDPDVFKEMVWSGDRNADAVEGVWDSESFTEWNNSDTDKPMYIRLGIGTDGFSYDSKGFLHCWGLVGLLMNLPQRIREKIQHSLFLALCLWNSADNPPFHRLFQRFEDELLACETQGFTVHVPELQKDILFKVKVVFYTTDNKGRQKLVGACSHNSFFSCHKCVTMAKRKGYYLGVRKLTHPVKRGRTYHIKRYPRWNIVRYTKVRRLLRKHPHYKHLWSFARATTFMKRVERILQLPVEPMHNFYQGTYRDQDRYLYEAQYKDEPFSLREFKTDICDFVTSLVVPTTLRRAPLSIDENRRKTANSTLIEKEVIGPVVYYVFLGLRKNSWNEFAYFLLKCCSTRSLNEKRITKSDLMQIERMLEIVCLATIDIIGPEACTSKFHQHTHIVEDCLRFGSPNETQMFAFESFWNLLKKECQGCTRGVGEQMLEAGLVKLLVKRNLKNLTAKYPELKAFQKHIDFSKKTLPDHFEEIAPDIFIRPQTNNSSATPSELRHLLNLFPAHVNDASSVQLLQRAHINGHLISSVEWTQARLTTTSVIYFKLNGCIEFGKILRVFRVHNKVFLKVRHFQQQGSLLDGLREKITNTDLLTAWDKGYYSRVNDFWRIVRDGHCLYIDGEQLHGMASECELDGLKFVISYPDVFKAP